MTKTLVDDKLTQALMNKQQRDRLLKNSSLSTPAKNFVLFLDSVLNDQLENVITQWQRRQIEVKERHELEEIQAKSELDTNEFDHLSEIKNSLTSFKAVPQPAPQPNVTDEEIEIAHKIETAKNNPSNLKKPLHMKPQPGLNKRELEFEQLKLEALNKLAAVKGELPDKPSQTGMVTTQGINVANEDTNRVPESTGLTLREGTFSQGGKIATNAVESSARADYGINPVATNSAGVNMTNYNGYTDQGDLGAQPNDLGPVEEASQQKQSQQNPNSTKHYVLKLTAKQTKAAEEEKAQAINTSLRRESDSIKNEQENDEYGQQTTHRPK